MEEFGLHRLAEASSRDRPRFSGGPDEDPGIRLSNGYMPGKTFAGIAYMHVAELKDNGEYILSSPDAVEIETGLVREPGEVILVDLNFTPPSIIRKVGSFILTKEDDLTFEGKPLI